MRIWRFIVKYVGLTTHLSQVSFPFSSMFCYFVLEITTVFLGSFLWLLLFYENHAKKCTNLSIQIKARILLLFDYYIMMPTIALCMIDIHVRIILDALLVILLKVLHTVNFNFGHVIVFMIQRLIDTCMVSIWSEMYILLFIMKNDTSHIVVSQNHVHMYWMPKFSMLDDEIMWNDS